MYVALWERTEQDIIDEVTPKAQSDIQGTIVLLDMGSNDKNENTQTKMRYNWTQHAYQTQDL